MRFIPTSPHARSRPELSLRVDSSPLDRWSETSDLDH